MVFSFSLNAPVFGLIYFSVLSRFKKMEISGRRRCPLRFVDAAIHLGFF